MERTTQSNPMRKLTTALALVLAVLVIALVSGCSSADSSSDTSEEESGEVYNVAIVQLADNDAFTEMSTAFIDQMTELGYEEDVNIVYEMESAQGDSSNLQTICSNLAADTELDLIVSIVTPATQAAVNAEPDCPVVFISVTDPVGAGIMTSMDEPDKNATGTSNVIPIDEIFELAAELTPDATNVGLLYCSGESNAVLTIEDAREYLDENGYTYEEQSVASSSEVQQAAESLAATCDMIYVPVDSTVQSAMELVVEAATEAGIPVYGSDPVMVSSGALGSVSVSNTQLGQRSAEMADMILQGTDVSEIPAEALTEYQVVLNSTTAETLSIELPDDDSYTIVE